MTEIDSAWRPRDPDWERQRCRREFLKWIFAFSAIVAVLSSVLYVSSGNYHEKLINAVLIGNPLRGAQQSSFDESLDRIAH